MGPAGSGGRSGPVLGVRGGRVAAAVAVAVCALAGSGVVAGEAAAYQSFYTPLFASPPPDPCSVQGVGAHGGMVVRRQPAIQENDIERSVALLCSPIYTQPFGTLLADDGIWQRYLGRGGGPPRHMLQGGQDSLPWKQTVSTKNHPAFKGPGGNALGWKDLIAIDDNFATIQAALGPVLGADALTPAVTACVIGLTVAIPVTAVPCAVGAVVVAVTATLLLAPQIINLIGRYFQRNDAMNNGNWFVWSSGPGFFNGFGDVDTSWINPSLFAAGDRQQMRVGVVFSNVLLNQGPDFDLSRTGAADTSRQARRLGALVRRMERSQGRTRTGTRRGERLFGGARDDYLFAAAGRDSLYGRRGSDVLLQGARGNDRILGGPGNDNIDGHRGGDVLSGGPGNDQIVDLFGHTTARTGPGRDLVVVRDGHGDDTVVCTAPGRKRILADPGDRIVKARSGHTGRAACPPDTGLITTGPLPRHGSGY
jgi:hypothetical protein